jgi:hypothetical protein
VVSAPSVHCRRLAGVPAVPELPPFAAFKPPSCKSSENKESAAIHALSQPTTVSLCVTLWACKRPPSDARRDSGCAMAPRIPPPPPVMPLLLPLPLLPPPTETGRALLSAGASGRHRSFSCFRAT